MGHISRTERFIDSKCDRCGRATPAKQNGIGELFALPMEWGSPIAEEGSFCMRCVTIYDQDNWLAWMKKHRPEIFLGATHT